jgi:hypothetical protein
MDLFEVEDHKWRGFETRKLNIGLWKMDANVTVTSHIVKPTLATFFVKVIGSLWLYMVSQQGQPPLVCVIDGPVAKLRIDELPNFGAPTLEEALNKLAKGMVMAYEFRNNKWEQVDADFKQSLGDLDAQSAKSSSAENVVPALPAPKALPKHQATGH